MWDEYQSETFMLRAIIFVTINDYQNLFSLSRYIIWKTNCVLCLNEIYYVYLDACYKTVYMRHRRFLVRGHMF
jgi:prepilin signal peptidase PulO-like enzyme (type II secretory pathway)